MRVLRAYPTRGVNPFCENETWDLNEQSRKRYSDHTSTDTKNSVYVVRYLRGFEVGLVSVRGRARREWAPRAARVCTVVLDSVVTGPLEAPTVVEESSILLSQDRSCPPRICIV